MSPFLPPFSSPWTYDGYGNAVATAQSHSGAVDSSTPTVQYTFDDGAVSGEAHYVRLTKVTYPGGREVDNDDPASDFTPARGCDPPPPTAPLRAVAVLLGAFRCVVVRWRGRARAAAGLRARL